MPEIDYLDFDIEIEQAAQSYRIEVNSPAGQSSSAFQPPFSELELENFLLKLGQNRRVMRRIDAPDTEAAKTFGARLFDATFNGDIRACLRSSLDEATRQSKGLRIRLRLTDTPELADLPWEYLYHSALNRFLALSNKTPLVRYLELPERIAPLAVATPLRVLTVIASPRDQPTLDTAREWQRLQEALGELIERGLVTIERLEQASLLALQQQLRRNTYHILHFIGHGGFDTHSQDGVLMLEEPDGSGYRISGQDLGMLLHDHQSLRLVVLNACEGARTSRTDPFAGAAQSLVQQGLPAVIAMQFEISDEAAIILAREFYGALADSYPVDAALTEARKMLFAAGSGTEWGTPVLYLRAPDGKIFDVAAAASAPTHRATLLPEPPPEGASHERFLDAALPEQVVVGKTIELVTQIRLPESAGLRALLGQPDADFEAQPNDVRTRAFAANFPRDALGKPAPLELLLAIESTDFHTPTPRQKIRLDPFQDTEPLIFLLTPLKTGELRLVVHVYAAGELLLASGFLKVNGISQLAEGLLPLKRLISLSLGSFGIGEQHTAAVGIPGNHSPSPPTAQPNEEPPPRPAPEPAPVATSPAQSVSVGRTAWMSWAAPFVTIIVVALVVGAVYTRMNNNASPSSSPVPNLTSAPAAQTTTTIAATALPTVVPAPTSIPTPTNSPTAVSTVTAVAEATPGLTPADFAGWHELRALDAGAVVNGIAIAPNGQQLAAARSDRFVLLWRIADGTLLSRLDSGLARGRVTAVVFAPTGGLLAAARSDGAIVLWNAADRKQIRVLIPRLARPQAIQSIVFSHDGNLLAAGGDDQLIRLWRISDGTLLRTFKGHTASVWGLAFAPDDKTLASGANQSQPGPNDRDVWLWNVADGNVIRTFKGHSSGVLSVAFSPDGATLAAGAWDETVRLWNVADGTLLHTLEGHPRGAGSITFSPDGRVLASAAGDGNARLWDVASGVLLRALEGHTNWASSVAFTPDGAMLASGSADESIRIWGK